VSVRKTIFQSVASLQELPCLLHSFVTFVARLDALAYMQLYRDNAACPWSWIYTVPPKAAASYKTWRVASVVPKVL
jgi:hypothetical protein